MARGIIISLAKMHKHRCAEIMNIALCPRRSSVRANPIVMHHYAALFRLPRFYSRTADNQGRGGEKKQYYIRGPDDDESVVEIAKFGEKRILSGIVCRG